MKVARVGLGDSDHDEVRRLLDLDLPPRAVAARQVRGIGLLRNDALKAQLPSAGEELLAAIMHVVHVHEPVLFSEHRLQPAFPLEERELAEVAAVQGEKIEEAGSHRLAGPVKLAVRERPLPERLELGPAVPPEDDELAVE
jgi:hypothetical protein